MSARIDISGRVFEYIKVLDYSHTQHTHAYWNVQCLLCDNIFKASYTNLASGNTRACDGCAQIGLDRATRDDIVRRHTNNETVASIARRYDTSRGKINSVIRKMAAGKKALSRRLAYGGLTAGQDEGMLTKKSERGKMRWGTQADTAYVLYIREVDRDRAIVIIKEGLREYVPSNYFNAYEDQPYYETCELCNTPKVITFSTLIGNLDELMELSVDGRGRGKVKIVFGTEENDVTFHDAEHILEAFSI